MLLFFAFIVAGQIYCWIILQFICASGSLLIYIFVLPCVSVKVCNLVVPMDCINIFIKILNTCRYRLSRLMIVLPLKVTKSRAEFSHIVIRLWCWILSLTSIPGTLANRRPRNVTFSLGNNPNWLISLISLFGLLCWSHNAKNAHY